MTIELEWILRILIAAVLGSVIGLERERDGQPAGLRTHIILVIGSCLAMLLSLNLGRGAFDPARLAAAVLSGIGFLGAGAILREGLNIHGLTTAASLWTMTVVGLAVGAGYYLEAAAVTLIILAVLALQHLLEKSLRARHVSHQFVIHAAYREGIETEIREILDVFSLEVSRLQMVRDLESKELRVDAVLRVKSEQDVSALAARLTSLPDVKQVRSE